MSRLQGSAGEYHPQERAKNGPRMFHADEIRKLMEAATLEFRTMILPGINAGYGNTDCMRLEPKHLNLQIGWADFPHPKTGFLEREVKHCMPHARLGRERVAACWAPRSISCDLWTDPSGHC